MTTAVAVRVDPAPQLNDPIRVTKGRADAWSGAAAMLPLLASYAPFGCLVGVAVAHSPSPIAAWTGTWLIFAGSAHLIALQLTAAGSGVLVATLSALAVNVRLLVYSATIGPHWRGTSVRTRLVAAATIVDPTWMVASRRFETAPVSSAGRSFYGGAIGYLSANGDMDTCIALRTALVKDGQVVVQAGGGVVADSDPEAEFQESNAKARALIRAAEEAVRFFAGGNR